MSTRTERVAAIRERYRRSNKADRTAMLDEFVAVRVALRGSVVTEQVGALALKGLTQPVVAYNVPLVPLSALSKAGHRVLNRMAAMRSRWALAK